MATEGGPAPSGAVGEGGGTPLRTRGIAHPAFSGNHREATIRFYRDVLGMPIVLHQPNLDYEPEDHYFFHVGGDNFIAYFLPREGEGALASARSGSGWMDHLAIDVDPGSIEAWAERLRAHGVEFDGPVDRGYERSLYFKDPNGVTVELLSWLTPLPEGVSQAELILAAQERRRARGAAFVEDEDVRAALGL
jgi:catechol 2,3-dioxygenase-like lactoylglutathione lyase family enzyme